MGGIFVNYQQHDSAVWAKKLYKHLKQCFDRDQIFMDIEIEPGTDFVEYIESAVGSCNILLAIIGPGWLTSVKRNLNNPEGSNRHEIATALNRNIIVIPVLVGGAVMPDSSELPDDLKPLTRCQANELSDNRWEYDTEQLVKIIEKTGSKRRIEMEPPNATAPKSGRGLLGIIGLLGMIGELFHSKDRKDKITERRDDAVRTDQRTKPPLRDIQKSEATTGALPATDEAPTEETLIFDFKPAAEPAPVLLGASAPRGVSPGGEFTARFVAYVKALENEIRDTLQKISPRSKPVLGVQECRWLPGTRVVVRLRGRGLQVDPPEQAFVWEGKRNLLEFDVTVPADAAQGTVVLKFDVLIEGIVVARLRLDMKIAETSARDQVEATAEPVRSAFASYASADRSRVLDRVAAVRIAAGLDVFLDCLDIRPSEEWKPQLDVEIRKRDIFLLFWSAQAKESPWVAWEWHTALQDKGKENMQIHPLEPNVKPPEELADLHFGDVYMWVRKGDEATRPPSSGP